MGIDPTISNSQGIFVIPITKLIQAECMDSVSVAHYRDNEGYQDSRYDMINTDDQLHTFSVNIPKQNGDLYFTFYGYPFNLIPQKCTNSLFGLTLPIVYFALYRDET